METVQEKRKATFISKPLFKQSFKSLFGLWLAMTIGSILIVLLNIFNEVFF